MSLNIKDGDTILFLGDSITDSEREKESGIDLGKGFVKIVSGFIKYIEPNRFVKVFNRGVAGDSMHEILPRLDNDCLKLKPDIVSIMVGVNDSNYRAWIHDDPAPIEPDEFEKCYREMLDRIKQQNPNIQFVLITPYLCNVTKEHRINKILLKKYVAIIENLAKEYNCILVPMYDIMEKEQAIGRHNLWVEDGAHPTDAGALFFSKAWIKYALDMDFLPEI